MKVYVDLDGVVADFERAFNDTYPAKLSSLSHDELAEYKKNFAKEGVFGSLPVFQGSKRFIESLVKMGHEVEILTAVSEYDSAENAKQKAKWVKTHLGDIKFNWVKKSHEKAKFAGPGVLLIDDRDKSIVPFKRAGGLTIKHTKFSDTLKKMKLLKESKPMKTYKEFLREEKSYSYKEALAYFAKEYKTKPEFVLWDHDPSGKHAPHWLDGNVGEVIPAKEKTKPKGVSIYSPNVKTPIQKAK